MKSNTKHAVLIGFAGVIAGLPAEASSLPELCESAASLAAERQNIPAHILQTLTLAETGKTVGGALRPWPWAINRAGEGHWFSSQDEMLAYAETLIAAGQTNFDIGCFQLNYRWHGQEFTSLEQMSDPEANAAYAAWFLRSKYMALGSWKPAVGAYHSQTEAHATAYLARFEAIFARWVGGNEGGQAQAELEPTPAQPADRTRSANTFPLLIAGQIHQGASLVPVTNGRSRLIGALE